VDALTAAAVVVSALFVTELFALTAVTVRRNTKEIL
jgi:hypothetical protein